jgi:polar amino acid transport system substrate-binding protein
MFRNNGVKLAACTLMASALFSSQAMADKLDQVRTSGTLKVAVYNDFGPYSCLSRDGSLTGVNVELARALAEKMDLKLELMGFGSGDSMDEDLKLLKPVTDFDEWSSVRPGDAVPDIMMHVPMDPQFIDRNPGFSFFAPYLYENMAVLYDKSVIANVPDVVNSPDPFLGQNIGVEMYTLSYIFLTNGFDGRLRNTVDSHRSVTLAVDAMLKGEVSAVMAPRAELQSALASFKQVDGSYGISALTDLFRTDRVRSEWNVGIAALNNDNSQFIAAVEQALGELRDSGEMKAVFANYGMPWVPAGSSIDQAMAGLNGTAGLTRQGLESSRICGTNVPAGLL